MSDRNGEPAALRRERRLRVAVLAAASLVVIAAGTAIGAGVDVEQREITHFIVYALLGSP